MAGEGPPYKEFDKQMNVDLPSDKLAAHAYKMANELLRGVKTDELVEYTVKVDFTKAPKCLTFEEKKDLVRRIKKLAE